MSSEAQGSGGASSDARLPLIELDRALAPIRRLAAWGSAQPVRRGAEVAYLEAAVERWTDVAMALDLPEPVRELLQAQSDAVVGYDIADPESRSLQLVSLYQAVSRLDALLGLPLHGVAIHEPRKPRLPNWRVEEKVELPPEEAVEPKKSGREAPSGRQKSPEHRRKVEAPEVAPPPPPFWSGRMTAPLASLELPSAARDALEGAGLVTVEDLLMRPPAATEHLRPIHGAGRPLPEGEPKVAIGGRVKRRCTVVRPDGTRHTRVEIKGAGRATLVWERGSAALEAAGGIDAYELEARVIAAGRPVAVEEQWEILEPERAWDDEAGGVRLRSYGLSVDDVLLRGLIGRLLPFLSSMRDLLPGADLARLGQEPMRALLPEMHHRDEERARRRLAFDEALLVQLGLSLSRYRQGRDRGLQVTPLHGLVTKLESSHGLVLSDAQLRTFEDIKRDLRRKTPMRRVITGAVGSGRGAVALLTIAAVAEGKVQVMVLAPDAHSAELRYLFAALPLKEGGLVARLVEGEPTQAVRDAVGRGEVHVVFGTLELLQHNLEFRRLGLVVAEEQQDMGAVSASLDQRRAPRPHALILPRIPVDAHLALTAYADHDISELAGGAPEPKVGLVPATDRSVVYGRAAEAISAGGQVLVVFPLVRGTDALDIREAWRLVKALESDAFGKARMGLFHGSMSREERLSAYDDFCRRRVDVLVATALIEDAPPSAGAVTMVLEQAERFTPERQLRLRGFLQPERGEPAIWCVYSGEQAEAAERLATLLDPTGSPALDVRAAEGAPALPVVDALDPSRDAALIWTARAAAHRLAATDPRLRSGWAVDVGRALRARWNTFYGPEAPDLKLEEARSTPSTASAASDGGGTEAPRAPSSGRRRRRRRRKG